jgi:hypothetical protein
MCTGKARHVANVDSRIGTFLHHGGELPQRVQPPEWFDSSLVRLVVRTPFTASNAWAYAAAAREFTTRDPPRGSLTSTAARLLPRFLQRLQRLTGRGITPGEDPDTQAPGEGPPGS